MFSPEVQNVHSSFYRLHIHCVYCTTSWFLSVGLYMTCLFQIGVTCFVSFIMATSAFHSIFQRSLVLSLFLIFYLNAVSLRPLGIASQNLQVSRMMAWNRKFFTDLQTNSVVGEQETKKCPKFARFWT